MGKIGSVRIAKQQLGPLTVKVHLPRAFSLRIRIVIVLLRLAGWISPVQLEIEYSPDVHEAS